MSLIKLSMALALFFTSITFQEQIFTNGSLAEVSWSSTISTNQALANQHYQEHANQLEMMY
jgi:hypothetical protein